MPNSPNRHEAHSGRLDIEELAAARVVEAAPRRPTPEERAAERREEILDAAARVFASYGYHAAGISDIATEIGVAHGTLYRYFKSKQEIGEHLLDRVLQRLAQTLLREDPAAAHTLEEFREQIVRIIYGVFELYENSPDLMRFFQHQSMTIDADRSGTALDAFTDYVERFMRNGVARSFLRGDLDIEVMSQSFVGVMFDVLRRMLRSPDAAALRDRWVAHGPTALLDGIAS